MVEEVCKCICCFLGYGFTLLLFCICLTVDVLSNLVKEVQYRKTLLTVTLVCELSELIDQQKNRVWFVTEIIPRGTDK
jgi:hypothetical protein